MTALDQYVLSHCQVYWTPSLLPLLDPIMDSNQV